MLLFFSNGYGATPGTPAQSYAYFTGYDYEPAYYVGGPPSQFTFPYFPFMAVIDLNTGILVGKDLTESDYLMPNEIVDLVQAANGE
jgi:hypothetical protein